jgi:hypothetical protein
MQMQMQERVRRQDRRNLDRALRFALRTPHSGGQELSTGDKRAAGDPTSFSQSAHPVRSEREPFFRHSSETAVRNAPILEG